MVVSIICDGWVLNGLSFVLSYPQVFSYQRKQKASSIRSDSLHNKTTLICNIPSALQEPEKVQQTLLTTFIFKQSFN